MGVQGRGEGGGDHQMGIIRNLHGRVVTTTTTAKKSALMTTTADYDFKVDIEIDDDTVTVPGLYVVGCIKRVASRILGTSISNDKDTVNSVIR